MRVYRIDPLRDPRWPELLERHPRASIFHTPGWLETLRRTYGYEPIVLTTSPPRAQLTNGLAFCFVNSWVTGRRVVSLPFSDHCEPLVDDPEEVECLLRSLRRDLECKNCKYIEIRPVSSMGGAQARFETSGTYYLHTLDLRRETEEIFRNFHHSCIQRKIRRAGREGLTYEEGRSEALLEKFYHLLLITRRKHGFLPQPRAWFRNLIACLEDKVSISVVSKDDKPVAGILTLSYRDTLVYKYGCSDAQFNKFGGMISLLWRMIQKAKLNGARVLDMGRSDCNNTGLVTFKDRWGSSRSLLNYVCYPAGGSQTAGRRWQVRVPRAVLDHLPDGWLGAAGSLVYKHLG